ncbi:FAD-dependent oxidoreductase [Pseudolabrys taiwanensis]|uniref:FAD-dependent oxidoreductase n=1 Tax=Pseudolabrys taiwanensis TaxID=331696 RepID=A0A345ZWR5_9HYPH|nr:FAD-dependent monooxygenase [Pseudolabrys taiwanensis]AXK81362.1 FAD-dependent oxidoreductase [Pseudolabrys taiwanensis]
MPESGSRRAVIIGGSMSGLLTGLLLRRSGWDVDIFERVETELSGRGAGIVAQPELIERLKGLGLPTEGLGVHIVGRKILDRTGEVVEEFACPQVTTAWERVYRLLRDAFPAAHYHRGRGLATLAQTPQAVTAYFSNGETVSADLLVGADGIRSTVRGQCLPDVGPRYAGYTAWRALLHEHDFPPDVHREVFAFMAFGLPPGEQFLGYPVAGPDNDVRPGHRRYNVIWYRPADEASKLKWLLTDDRGVTHAISIPPPLIRRDAIAEMHDAAERLLAPQLRQIVRLIKEPILQPIYDLESSQMAFGRVAILGDAAFVARPHVGAGVAKAADDAGALTDALTQEADVPAALKRFERARLAENHRIINYARHLGSYLQATRTEEEQARAGRHSTNKAVIKETATLDFLHA